MTRQTRAADAARQFRPQEAERAAGEGGDQRAPAQADPRNRSAGRRAPVGPAKPAPGPMKMLSVRGQNVLKELALELSGEQPPKGPWSPSRELLLALTAERLASARNCGPNTTREIIAWAQGCGVTIKPVIRTAGSLSEMWAELTAHAASGVLTSAQIVSALERSIRRKSVRIPIAFQIILVKILLSSIE
jgi:hypothetical protein